TREEAFEVIAGDDRRPMLVLRECMSCQGSDIALLSREFANERTILLTNWFHCVKLPQNVSQADHPFHNLFPAHSHLFLALADGKQQIDFDGKQSQKQLWKVMSEMLVASYERNPEDAVSQMIKLLAQFDIVDEKEARLMKELDVELEKNHKSPKIAKLQAEIADLAKEKAALTAKEKGLRKIDLKPVAAK
ncbi:MAG: hypothetical protein IPK26_19865, partial [Planctomycetes bacterium]|nr:hypothetical protein [Planctomycetota bacterium]